jgi:hypothetical protein
MKGVPAEEREVIPLTEQVRKSEHHGIPMEEIRERHNKQYEPPWREPARNASRWLRENWLPFLALLVALLGLMLRI